jgi:hypothetical protein
MRTWPALLLLVASCGVASCGTIDLGDNIVPPDLQLDEDFFHCEIQPNVLTAHSCATGGAGEEGTCHADQSSLRLEADVPDDLDCEDGMIVGGAISAESLANFDSVRFTVQSDPLSSPLYRRPTGLDSHPRVIFPPSEDDECAALIIEWINRGAL